MMQQTPAMSYYTLQNHFRSLLGPFLFSRLCVFSPHVIYGHMKDYRVRLNICTTKGIFVLPIFPYFPSGLIKYSDSDSDKPSIS